MDKLDLFLRIRSRLRFFILMIIAVLFCCVAGFYFVRHLVKPFTGLAAYSPELKSDNNLLLFAPRLRDSPAIRAGIRPGEDYILSINDTQLSSIRDFVSWESEHFSFEPVSVLVKNRTGTVRSISIRPELTVAQNDWYFILFFIVVLGGTALYILVHYHREITHVLFAFFCLFYMTYTSVLPFYFTSPATMFFVNLGELTAWFILFFLAFFQRDVFPRVLKTVIITGVAVVCVFFTFARFFYYLPWFFTGLEEYFSSLQFVGRVQNECDIIAYIFFLGLLVLIYFKTRQKDIKHHIEWITAGALLAIPPHFFFNQLPMILGSIQDSAVFMGNTSHLFLSFLPLSYVIGLVRSRGYKMQVFQTRSIIYIFCAFLLLAFFSIAYHPVQVFFTQVFKLNSEISGFIVAITLFITALYMQFIILLVIDHRLLREKPSARTLREMTMLEETVVSEAALVRERKKIELHDVTAGIFKRVETMMTTMRKACAEIAKVFPKENIDNEQSLETSKGEKLFNDLVAQLHSLEDFKKRFDGIFRHQTSIRISLSLNTIINTAIAQSRRRFSQIVITAVDQPQTRVFCSPEEITLSLLFVIENAYQSQARKEEPICIRIHSHRESATIEVADKGNGISTKIVSSVGQPFFTTKRGNDGLGLYFCRVLLERNGGMLEIEPGTETGTRVLLHIPVSKPASAPHKGKET